MSKKLEPGNITPSGLAIMTTLIYYMVDSSSALVRCSQLEGVGGADDFEFVDHWNFAYDVILGALGQKVGWD